MIHVGTINVHEWSNQLDKSTINDLILLLKQSNLDVVGIQETDERTISYVVSQLNEYNYIYHNKTALLSKHPIKKHIHRHNKERFVSGKIILPNQSIFVTCVHLDYKREPTRIKQMIHIMDDINHLINKYPSIILGDFNALTKKDYSKKEWDDIKVVRKYNKWELPITDLTLQITLQNESGWKLFDTKQLASMSLGPLATSRFNTRIDYIYVNKILTDLWDVFQLKHTVIMPFLTDHNLVTAMFIPNKILD